MDKTYIPKAAEITPEWYLFDANGQNLGRLATHVATILLGKHKPNFTPGMDTGGYVVIVNCERVQVTGRKMEEKFYHRHSIHPGGLTSTSLKAQLQKHPDRVLKSAVWGMLPHNKYGRSLMRKLKIYAGPQHPHEAQKPQPVVMG